MMEKLREALEHLEATYFGHEEDGQIVTVAARQLLNAPEQWWCEEHDAPGGPRDGGPFDDHCYEWWICEILGDECEGITPCRMVQQLRVDPRLITEETE